MRFVSKADNYQVYGALLPEVMTNQKMQASPAYKTYLAFVTGAATPKKARKFKKPASPLEKRTLVTVEEEEPEPAKKVVPSKKPSRKQSIGVQIQDTLGVSVSKKKAPGKAERSKGTELLSEAALLEEAQVKKVLKRSQRETTIHQAGGSSDGAGFQPKVLDESKGKSGDTCEGTGLKPGVPDVFKTDSSKSEYESWGDSGDEANVQGDDEDVQDSDDDPQQANDERTDSENQETNDDEEESDNEFVHTPEDYVPTNDEANYETKDVDEEEYERIGEEVYGDVNVRLIDAEHNDEEKGDADVTNAEHAVAALISSHSVSSTYTNAFLNLENLHSTEMEVVSMLDINVQHEVPLPESKTLSSIHQRICYLENDVKELKSVDNSTIVISTIKSEVLNAVKEYLRSSLDDALYKVIQKYSIDIFKEHSIPAEIVERLKQQYAPQKSIKGIRKIKMEHARKQQVPKETITSSDTIAIEEFD
ncbi:hypothetical protein Tco_0199243 [Tanacetum coccineum]